MKKRFWMVLLVLLVPVISMADIGFNGVSGPIVRRTDSPSMNGGRRGQAPSSDKIAVSVRSAARGPIPFHDA